MSLFFEHSFSSEKGIFSQNREVNSEKKLRKKEMTTEYYLMIKSSHSDCVNKPVATVTQPH